MKKESTCILLLAFLIMLGQSLTGQTVSYPDSWNQQGFSLQEESASGVTINYSLTDFTMVDVNIDGIVSKSIKVPGVFLPNDEGAPDLPGNGRYIAIPQGAEAVLNIIALRKDVIENVEIAPAPNIPVDSDPSPQKYEQDQKIYSTNQYYPIEPIQLSEKLNIRGVDAVMLGITPFQYNPVTKELIVYRDLLIEISFIGGNGQFGEDRLRSRWWDPLLHSSLINAQSLPKIDYSPQHSNSEFEGYEYIIITPDLIDFTSWADTIKDFRTKQGIKTGVVTTTEIGGNSVTAIENYIDNAYLTWSTPPSAVLLLGDYSTGSDGIISYLYDHPAGYPDYASDNRYADVNGDDLPDVILARITARNAAELEVMISKFIDYETNPPVDANFYDHPITALGWQTTRWFQICSETIGGYFKNNQGKNPVRINAVYSGNPLSDPWSTATNTSTVVDYFGPNGLGYIPATPQELGGFSGGTEGQVINAINDGSLLLQHRDHGNYTAWGEPDFDYYSINSLTNVNNKLPYIFSINCQTGAFHRSTECFAEKFHRHTYNSQNSGALGILAATEVSYSFVNDTYVWGVYDNMFPDFMPNETTQFPVSYVMPAFGNAGGKHFLFQSNWPYNTSDKLVTYRLFHHHGDAYLTLYTEVPVNLSVTHASSLLNTATSFSVTADAGSFIALVANGEILGTANGTGSPVSITIPVQSAGTVITVTVTKQNYYRYESNVDVIAGGILADFSADNTTICEGETVTFTDQSSGSITSWDWTFSGGTPGTYSGQTPPAITYNTAGTYDVTLIISDGSNNDTETKTAYITVDPLTADFTASQTSIPLGGSVTFTNLSTCADSYAWSFPGGNPSASNEANPGPIVYNTVGDHIVTLTAYNGGSDEKTMTIHVTDIQYCASNGNPGYEWIQSIDIGGLTNNSGQSLTGYEDFTGITYNLDPGSANTITFTPGFDGRSRFQYWNVWIDFNVDGNFDAEELVLSISKKKSVVVSTLNIPSSADGTTVMRISMKYGSYATSCETGFEGEVEDYTVNFAPVVPQPPIAAFTADNTTIAIGGTVNFTDQSQNTPTSWAWSFPGGTPSNSADQNPSVAYNGVGVYDVTLEVSNAQGSDILVETGYITVSDDPTPPYCVPVANNTNDWIHSITIGVVTHNSGQGSVSGYDYFTSPSFTFNPGSTYNVSLTPFNSSNKNFWRIWIDFNNDGDFDDANETVLLANNKKGTYSKSITIPTGVDAVSPDRMRITMKTGGAPSACAVNFNGEVEDYNVGYGADLFIPVVNKMELSIYPNPADNILNIVVSGNREYVNVKIYSAIGNLMQSFQMDDRLEQINLDAYQQGLYFIHINDGNERLLQKFIVR
ncbi:MAG: PKD domain-containing protein [Bacteroidales bacterium]|nr:PKD domain-containing protein [Bacteroidales bacterium]